jgi:alcohol dehydrogenase
VGFPPGQGVAGADPAVKVSRAGAPTSAQPPVEQVVFLSDILPTAFEVGVGAGMVTPGDTVAIVGAGPIGLAAILTTGLHTPGSMIAIDLADSRLDSARQFGANETVNNGREDAVARVMELTDGLGADVAIEAVGVPETFELCTELVRPEAMWPTWVCTAGPPPSIWKSCGSAT